MSATSVSNVFADFQNFIDLEQEQREEIRVCVKELEQTVRDILAAIQVIHTSDGLKNITSVCKQVRQQFLTVKEQFANLATKIPAGEYYRFNDHWRFACQRLAFLSALTIYLETEQLITREQMAEMLGVKVNREEGFHMDLEDYLIGTLTLASELSRLAVNSVVAGDYNRPVRIAAFVNELMNGFRLLNLKNDSLRKRFDGLKYDLKKVEEVVYDLSIRGLKSSDT